MQLRKPFCSNDKVFAFCASELEEFAQAKTFVAGKISDIVEFL